MNLRAVNITAILLVVMLFVACSPAAPSALPEPTKAPTKTGSESVFTITLNPDGCTYSGPDELPEGSVPFDMIVEDLDPGGSAVGLVYIQGDRTEEEIIEAANSSPVPSWLSPSDIAMGSETLTQRNIYIMKGPIYLVCMGSPPEMAYDVIGPLKVTGW